MTFNPNFSVSGWDVAFTNFTGAIVSNVANQSWTDLTSIRRQTHLPGKWEADGSFNSREITEILVRVRLAALGVGYDESSEVGCVATQSVLWHAISKHAGTCDIFGTPRDVARCHSKMANSSEPACRLTDLSAPHHFIIVGNDGTMQLTKLDAPDAHRAPSLRRPRIDLQDLANQIVGITQRPLFQIRVSRPGREVAQMLSEPCLRNVTRELLPV